MREVLLDRDVRAPEILSPFTSSRYLLRRYLSISGLVLVDVVSLCLAAFLVNQVRQAEDPLTERLPQYLLVASAVMVAMFALHGLYGLRERRRNLAAMFRAGVWSASIILVLSAVWGIWAPSYALSTALVAALLIHIGRELYDFCLRLLFSIDPEQKRAILVAAGPVSAHARGLEASTRTGSKVLGVVSESDVVSTRADDVVPCLGELADLTRIVERWRPDELIIMDPELERSHLGDIAELCRVRHLTLSLVDLEMRFSASGVSLIPGMEDALFVAAPSSRTGLAWFVKRCLDVVLAGVLLVVTAPLTAAIALVIKLTSRGPVFFSAERVGLAQRPFRCHKFRTMRADAHELQCDLEDCNEADGAIFKIRDDPRVTRVGRMLRATSLDELPQLYNVLRGEMSLVGPRPLPLRDNQLMEPWHRQRHVVLPGLTGLWQVNGRSDTSFDRMIALDLEYVESWSLWLDLIILGRTVRAVFAGRGAY